MKAVRQTYRKKTKAKKTVRPQVLVAVLFIAILIVGGTYGIRLGWKWLHSTPLFAVQEIKINGINRVKKQWVLHAIDLKDGENILGLKKEDIKERILENPWIKSLKISTDFPHTLVIDIVERRAIAFLKDRGKTYLLDSDGEIFKVAEGKEADGLIEIEGIKASGNGDRTIKYVGTFKEFVRLVNKRGRILCERNIKSVGFDGKSMVVTTRGSRIPLVFSLDQGLKVQFKRAESILFHLYSSGKYRHVKIVNLSVGKNMALAFMDKRV
ncbi:Cell division protein FtsQ [Dissulfuribacter thermophilus]|uniref:Cell division protein FtsQ n=1 Tax=Dissulfuribacter thermophilus TaxID=1156395 RepID=A0A1B9F4K9_9BACT|nr:FtsQ-type POTRA domain-containing protein [Dissulfuribacter thermophilus]OCC14755.1 Cell division protein FtsQ [Dissulfuribacter thermophilus]